MVNSESTADLLRNLSIISEDANLLKRAARYLRKLASEKSLTDDTLMSSAEYNAKIKRAEQQIKEGKFITLENQQQISSWLNSL